MNKNLNIINSYKKKIVLGTAQFGKVYGINNQNKKRIRKEQIRQIIKTLKKNGAKHIDNAESYFFDLKHLKDYKIIIDTKIEINKKNSDIKNIQRIINKYLIKKNLKLDTIYLHNPEMIFSDYGKKIFKNLIEFKKKKKFKNIGISVYDLTVLKKIISKYDIDAVQLPYNILDRRFENYFKTLVKKKIKINIRSIFLQGALIPQFNNKISQKPEIKKFLNFIKRKKLNKMKYCLGFVAKKKFINKIIVGVDNFYQLNEILNIKFKKDYLTSFNFSSSNLNIIDPRFWNKI